MEDQNRDQMLLQKVPIAEGLFDSWYCWMVMFNAFYQISDALFSVLIFYVYIEATDIFDVADTLGTKENLVFESASICI